MFFRWRTRSGVLTKNSCRAFVHLEKGVPQSRPVKLGNHGSVVSRQRSRGAHFWERKLRWLCSSQVNSNRSKVFAVATRCFVQEPEGFFVHASRDGWFTLVAVLCLIRVRVDDRRRTSLLSVLLSPRRFIVRRMRNETYEEKRKFYKHVVLSDDNIRNSCRVTHCSSNDWCILLRNFTRTNSVVSCHRQRSVEVMQR